MLAENAVVFLDDALIHGGTFDEHLKYIYSFLYAMEEQNLHLSAPTTQFMRPQCNYLGHVLSHNDVSVQPERVEALKNWHVPKSTTDVRAFLGFCVYHRRHIVDFGKHAAPLAALTAKTSVFTWGKDEQVAFENLRNVCCSPRVLSTPRTDLPFQLRCDALGFAAGCSLWQQHILPDETKLWRPIEFRSKSFSAPERKKAAHIRELLSFVGGLKYFKSFLAGVPFEVVTDSSAVAWLKSSREQSPSFERWWAYISSFTFSIVHRPGKRIVTEDALSRRADLEHTTMAADMLSLPTPEDYGLPDPDGTAPASSLAGPLIKPSYVRPPLDHDGILLDNAGPSRHAPRPISLTWVPEDDLVTCAALSGAAASLKHPAPENTLLSGNENLSFREILDHSLFGRELDTTHSDALMGHFPVRPSLRPSRVTPEMPDGGSYTMALVIEPPRRSQRFASTTSKEAEQGDIDSPNEVSDSRF
jgi:hypothetical protein